MLFLIAFGVPKKSVFTRLFDLFATVMLANFQDRLVMTTSISLRVCYLIVLFLAFRILNRDHFGRVFYRFENGVFWTSFGGRRLASSRGCQTFQDRLVMTASITLRIWTAVWQISSDIQFFRNIFRNAIFGCFRSARKVSVYKAFWAFCDRCACKFSSLAIHKF